MFKKRLNRLERRQFQKEKLARNLSGTGLYIYENNTNGTLKLPKPTDSGKRVISPKEQFQGDSYFMSLVKPPNNLLKLIKVVMQNLPETQEEKLPETKNKTIMESNMNEEKLILDQPNRITSEGTVEQVIVKKNPIRKINDSVERKQPQKEILLTEDPMDGIEIILN